MRELLDASQSGASTSIEELKKLPIGYVLTRAGVDLEEVDGVVKAICPFHPDSSPSLDIYWDDKGGERWGCYPCGVNGDVLDMIGKLNSVTAFGEKAKLARELLKQYHVDGWTGPKPGVKKVLDIDAVRARVANAGSAQTGTRDAFLEAKSAANPGLAMSGDWLVDWFGIGEELGSIVIPYWTRGGELLTMKYRTAHTKAMSAPGSQFGDVLYGEWADRDPERTVVLCEGESDAWAAAYALRDDPRYVVLGLPTGSGAHPKQAASLKGRNVILAFDGDQAGRAGNIRWHEALAEEDATVRLAPMPDGYDMAKLNPGQIVALVNGARHAIKAHKHLEPQGGGYYKPGKEENFPVSNWTFRSERELVGDTGTAYEGVILPLGNGTTLSSFDLASKPRIIAWSARHGGVWYGSDQDTQILLGMLQAEGPFLATGKMATVAGLHEGHFIWPGGKIGPDYWLYVEPPASVHLADMMAVVEGDWNIRQVNWMRALHTPAVMDPVLAWLAVSPLRSMLREFPILAVTGSSGSGKTTLLETILPAFTGSHITTNLTSTTEHALFSFVGSSNAFPIHFDEYRRGARKETMLSLQQILRDAYTGQGSSKGGMGKHWAEVTSVSAGAPIIVSGEDAFSETSHTERMVLVSLPLEGKNPEALKMVRSWTGSGFTYAYLSWLQEKLSTGDLPKIHNYSAGPEELPARVRLNIGVLELGWDILGEFVTEHGGQELSRPDWSLITSEAEESSHHNPIKDAILWALDEADAAEFLVIRDGTVHMRIENFLRHVNRNSEFQMPGGPEAIRKYLGQHYGARGDRVSMGGKQVRSMSFPAAALDS